MCPSIWFISHFCFYFFLSKPLPFDTENAPDDQYEIVEILAHNHGKGDIWWVYAEHKSQTDDYEGGKAWVQLAPLFQDCKQEVDEGWQDSNLVIEWAKSLEEACTKELAEAVAVLAASDPKELFPKCPYFERKSSPKKASSNDEPTEKECTCDHKDSAIYIAESNPFYWQEESSDYYGCPCTGEDCVKIFGTGAGMIKPTAKEPLMVCKQYHLGKTTCKEMVCTPCYKEKIVLSTADTRSSRRSATRRGTSKK